MNYEEGKDMLPGMAVGKGSVCLFRKTVWKGQSSICLANSDGIVGIGIPFRQTRGCPQTKKLGSTIRFRMDIAFIFLILTAGAALNRIRKRRLGDGDLSHRAPWLPRAQQLVG